MKPRFIICDVVIVVAQQVAFTMIVVTAIRMA